MGLVTLTKLVARARSRADMPLVGFITAQELIDWINEGAQALHEKLVAAYAEQYVSTTIALNTVAGTSDYALPADFFKLLGIDLQIAGKTRALRPFMFAERNAIKNSATITGSAIPKYLITGNNIRLLPAVLATTGSIYYAPEFTLLAAVGDTCSFPNGWEKYVVNYAAMQMLLKEETDVSTLMANQQKWDADLQALIEERDAAFPHSQVDVDSLEIDELRWP